MSPWTGEGSQKEVIIQEEATVAAVWVEFPVYGSTETDTHEEATAGIVDAIAFDEDGAPQVVIDWKSDVAPSPETLEHYRAQVRAHLDMSGAERGMVVCVTSGIVRCVTRDGEERAD